MSRRVILEACHPRLSPAEQLKSELNRLLQVQAHMTAEGYDAPAIAKSLALIALGKSYALQVRDTKSEIIGAQEAAELLQVGVNRVTELIKKGYLPAGKLGVRWLMMRQDVISLGNRLIQMQTIERVTALGEMASPPPQPYPVRRKGRFARKY